MSRAIRALILLLLVASCGSRNYSAPRELDNACSIVNQHPDYLRAFKATQRKWDVPVPVIMAIIYQESKFIGNNRPPHRYALGVIPVGRQSSAYGYSQALDGTWEEYQDDHGGRRARRDNIRDATDFMGWYMAQSRDRLGIPMTNARNHYLAYHEGRSGYARGSYNSKGWLLRISQEVADRAVLYDVQLRQCGKL
ncbi:MAG: lytic transglycosylase [Rhodobacterales bacterium]|nr:MAG: lytic transglycosylase [Rhodobacterales bacterium]